MCVAFRTKRKLLDCVIWNELQNFSLDDFLNHNVGMLGFDGSGDAFFKLRIDDEWPP